MAEQISGPILQNVFTKLDGEDCARAACVDRTWRQVADEDAVWKALCLRELRLCSAVDHAGNKCVSFKEAYVSWKETFSGYPMPLVARTKLCWDTIKDWLRVNFPDVLDTLAPGCSSTEIENAEQGLGFALPDSVRLLYQMCDGQYLPEDDGDLEGSTFYLGLLGGYRSYDHIVNVQLLPLNQVVSLSIHPRLKLNLDMGRIVIAQSFKSRKLFYLDCNDGQVYVGTRNYGLYGDMMPCTPVQERGAHPKDGMLRWLEYYGQCLQGGMFCVTNRGSRSISLFPLKEPLCTKAISHGLQVQCSAVFVPELSNTDSEEDENRYIFAYSVRIRLLQENNVYHGKLMESAQLEGRHWIIRSGDKITNEIRGNAVIGKYPCLEAGGEEFVYESCCNQKDKTGSMEGDFTFVPGRISRREGAPFAAYVARFPLQVPDYIF